MTIKEEIQKINADTEQIQRARIAIEDLSKVTLQCNECGKKRKVSANGNYNERCPKCGGVDWDVL